MFMYKIWIITDRLTLMFFLMSWTHLKDMHLNTKTKTKSDSLSPDNRREETW